MTHDQWLRDLAFKLLPRDEFDDLVREVSRKAKELDTDADRIRDFVEVLLSRYDVAFVSKHGVA